SDWVTQCKTKDRTSQPDVLATRTFREATGCLTGNTWWPSLLEDQKCHSTEEPQKPGEQNATQAAAAQGKGVSPAVSCGCHQVRDSLRLVPSQRESTRKYIPPCSWNIVTYCPILNSHQELPKNDGCDGVSWQNGRLVPQMRTCTEPRSHPWMDNQNHVRRGHDKIDTGVDTQLWDASGKAFSGDTVPKAPRTPSAGRMLISNQCGSNFSHNPAWTLQGGSSCVKTEAKKPSGKTSAHAHHSGPHKRTNTGVKSYRCRECGRAFVYQSFLRRHMDIHIGEQPYECQQCGKAFRYSLHLNKHLTKHIVSKNYACQECGKAFPKSSKLTSHIRTHSAERPYACEECRKTFTKSSGLQRHLKTHR
ncbi:zinc finger protein 114, partial [Marmota monax]|uniref:zinc finger protein 114 n=1 Tax=Marmota monax TaxID=9995 RepID=UPI001EB040EF